jgi:hypothetical protein
LKGINIQNIKIVEYKREVNADKANKIEGQQLNQAYTLELPTGATKKLSKYILDNDLKTTSILKFWRTGDKFETEYNFMLENKNPSME